LTVDLPDVEILSTPKLPENWKIYPPSSELKKVGDAFVRSNSSLILKVPSAIMPLDMSLLVNPSHPDFSKIKILDCEELELEKRLFRVEKNG
ncbi:MAG TPA: RES family NAD+ phosphorylase, partial [Catalimonadaceae bacterium]|nr:RES family NAD+ phosphorylase [Catalimonadaceae bacterium]